MKAREYDLLDMAVRDGVEYGWNRAHKYVDDPSAGAIKDEIHQGVMQMIVEWFALEDDVEDPA